MKIKINKKEENKSFKAVLKLDSDSKKFGKDQFVSLVNKKLDLPFKIVNL